VLSPLRIAAVLIPTVFFHAALAAQSTGTPTERVLVRKFTADSFWTFTWTRGYDREEDLFIEPRIITHAAGAVVVVDLGSREVLAFDPATGKSLLRMPARMGSGPGEFKRPYNVIPVHNGFAIADQGNARLSAFDLRGALLWDSPLPEPMVGGLCVQSARRIVMKRYNSDRVEARDTSGALIATSKVPWGKNSRESLSQGVQVVGPGPNGHCAILREFGGQFALVSPTGSMKTFSYVEQLPEPKVVSSSQVLEKNESGTIRQQTNSTTSRQSGLRGMIRRDTLIVQFGGESTQRLRLLDYYSLLDGRYIHSRVLPGGFVALTIAPDGTFLGTEIGGDNSGLLAMRPSRVAPRKPASRDSAHARGSSGKPPTQ
jgi:hypothetical protein